jgi:putative exporter of polyketide antibiotics
MFNYIDKAIFGMAILRILSGSIEILAAFLILKVNQVDKALIINSSLSIVGPIIFLLTTAIGLYSIASDISFSKLMWIFIGIGCILYGIKST